MEITKDNYDEFEPKILSDIENCDFLSFDLEMTGIAQYSRHFMDSPEERYLKQKMSAEKFRIIQWGIVAWKLNAETKTYIARPYNIYAFPSEDNGNSQLNCEVSAIIFNRDHGMDFNKWINKGVTYWSSKQYKYWANNILENNINNYDPTNKNKYKNITWYREEDREKYNAYMKEFSGFIFDDTRQSFSFERLPRFFLQYILNNLDANIRNNIYFKYEVNTETNKEELVTIKLKEGEKKVLLNDDTSAKLHLLNKAKGVKNIFDAIIKNKKDLVGHNMSCDIWFCISHFEDQLPPKYSEFKTWVNNYFGGWYDTKYMYSFFSDGNNIDNWDFTSAIPNRMDSSLEVMYERLFRENKDKVVIEIPKNEGFKDYLSVLSANTIINSNDINQINGNKETNSNQYHQADYDAFVTGSAFVYMKELFKSSMSAFNFQVYLMKSFYKCFNWNGIEDYQYPNSFAYCLKSRNQNCEFPLHKILGTSMQHVKQTYFVEGFNTMMILVSDEPTILKEIEELLSKNGNNHFEVLSLPSMKKRMKEDELKFNKRNHF